MLTTKAFIGRMLDDSVIWAVYCHFDGYPRGVGDVLFKHYQDTDKLDQLIDGGSLYSLDERIDCPKKHTGDTPVDGCTVFYHRDRGSRKIGPYGFRDYDSFLVLSKKYCVEFVYLFCEGRWLFYALEDDYPVWQPLVDVLEKDMGSKLF